MAQRILDRLQDVLAEQKAEPLSEETRHQIRMTALLHDLAHIPYGHTLENELGVVAEHHDSSPDRLDRFFGRLKEEISNIAGADTERVFPLMEYAQATIHTIKVIDDEIQGKEISEERRSAALPLEEWFVADIIGNTICADLLDYARRDMRAAGLNQEYDDRILSYFELAHDKKGRRRLALRVAKEQGLRLDAVSEIFHVLRIRYILSERVLFHHTKNVASAMLGEALSLVDFGPAAFDELTDEQLLPWIRQQAQAQEKSPQHRSGVERLVTELESRRLYKAVFRVGPEQQKSYEVANACHLGNVFANAKARVELRDEILERFKQLSLGDVIVYCPPPQMTMKEIWANVLARKDESVCRPLREEGSPYLPDVVTDEVEALESKYKALWSWNLMLAPDRLEYALAIQAFLQQKLNVANDAYVRSYLERELTIGREVATRAGGDYSVQAKAVEIALREPEKVAAAGPPDEDAYWDDVVRRARDELYPGPTDVA